MPNHLCAACDYSTDHKSHFVKHLSTLAHQQKIKELEQVVVIEEKEGMRETILDLKDRIWELEYQLKTSEERIKEKDILLNAYIPIVERATAKPNIINVTNNRNTTKNVLNLLSPEPIDWAGLEHAVPKLLTVDSLMTNDRKFNGMVTDALFRDGQGNPKLVCSDIARKNFQYKDEKSGGIVSDPCLERLREKLKAGVNYKLLYRELLEYLDSMGGDKGDNPEEAHKILRRGRFEQSFVNYVAKRMYSRSLATIKFIEDENTPISAK